MYSPNSQPQTILLLVANPKDSTRLRLDQELRDIDEGLQRAQKRDQFSLKQRLSVRPRDIHRAMLDIDPEIVHFSGHGTGDQGLVFEDEIGNAKLVDAEALASLFALFADRVRCVVLNGCYSEVQARAIAQHIPYVIGMNQAIGDKAAIAFAVGFYDALGSGRDIEFAHKLGCAAIRLEGVSEYLTPVLLQKLTKVVIDQEDEMGNSNSISSTFTFASTDKLGEQQRRKLEVVVDQEDEMENSNSISSTFTFASTDKLGERQRRKLEEKQSDLEEEYHLLSEKLKRIRKAKAIETDPSIEFKLEQQIEEIQQDILSLEQELDKIEQELR
jgi:hypothetical protein